jgi:monoamine oxidase
MAGLTAAFELQRAGHDPFIREAQQRVGGRVCTLRDPFTYGLYAEAGAMRILMAHDLTLACVEIFNLTTEPTQQTLLYDHIIAPEGSIYFVGKHTSFDHAWIQGAIESGCVQLWKYTGCRARQPK